MLSRNIFIFQDKRIAWQVMNNTSLADLCSETPGNLDKQDLASLSLNTSSIIATGMLMTSLSYRQED